MDGIPLFLTVGSEVRWPLRYGTAIATLARWREELDAGTLSRIVVQDWDPEAVTLWWRVADELGLLRGGRVTRAPLDPGQSQRERHAQAARLADSDVYVVCDSDIILMRHLSVRDEGEPDPPRVVEYLAGLVRASPRFAMVSPLPQPGGTWPGSGAQIEGGIWHVQNCGGIRFVRRGAIEPEALPPLDADQDGARGFDGILGRHLEARGLACGYAVRVMCVHLGYASSLVWGGTHSLRRD